MLSQTAFFYLTWVITLAVCGACRDPPTMAANMRGSGLGEGKRLFL